MTILKNFTRDDMFAFQGAENFPDGSVPRIYHFSDEEIEALFDLLGQDYDEGDDVWILHHAEGIVLGWMVGGEVREFEWEAGDASERVEFLLESLTSHTLPLWAMSIATVVKR